MPDEENLISEIESRVEDAIDEQLEKREKFGNDPSWEITIDEDISDGSNEAKIIFRSDNNFTKLINNGDCIGYIVFEIDDGDLIDSLDLMM
jgi:hypothetical protein